MSASIVVLHTCGHVHQYEPHPDTPDSTRARIALSESVRKCAECIAKEASAKEKR